MKKINSQNIAVFIVTLTSLSLFSQGLQAKEAAATCADAYIESNFVGRSGSQALGAGLMSSLGVLHPFGVSGSSTVGSLTIRRERQMKKTYELIEQSYVGDGERLRELQNALKEGGGKVPTMPELAKVVRGLNEDGAICTPEFKGDPKFNGRNLIMYSHLENWLIDQSNGE
ncbi:hypothetical protein GW915_12925 [bacterium]|nr:hypothetical protein [bacterium]